MAIPVTIDDAARHLRLTPDELDDARRAEIEGFIADAAAWVERYTGHILEARDVAERLKGVSRLHLTAWPVKGTAAPQVTYSDCGGTPISVAGARVDVTGRPARLMPPIGARWPWPSEETQVMVTVCAGYEPEDTVPGDFRRAILILIGAYDADREGGDLFGKAEATARRLCSGYRLRRV